MGTNFIPFSKNPKNKSLNKGPTLISKGPKKTDDGAVLDHGTIGDLEYKIYSRGVIIILDPENPDVVFKKDINIFERELSKIDFNRMIDKDKAMIEGSGDNDNIIFVKKDGDIDILIKKREFKAIEKLKNILSSVKL